MREYSFRDIYAHRSYTTNSLNTVKLVLINKMAQYFRFFLGLQTVNKVLLVVALGEQQHKQ